MITEQRSDDQLDELFRDWARDQVDATPPPASPALDAEAEIIDLRPPAPRRRSRMWWVAASIIVLAAAAVLGAVLATHGGPHDHAADVPTSSLYHDWFDPKSHLDVSIGPGTVIAPLDCQVDTLYALRITPSRLIVGRPLADVSTLCGGLGSPRSGITFDPGSQLQRVLSSKPTWSLDGNTLTLTAPDGTSVTLRRRS